MIRRTLVALLVALVVPASLAAGTVPPPPNALDILWADYCSRTQAPECLAVTPAPTPAPTVPPTVAPTVAPTAAPASGVWASTAEVLTLPVTGTPWANVAAAMTSTVKANVADQNSTHDIVVMGQALYAVRTGDAAARTKALASLSSAIGTESGARWLAIGRNLGGYIIAADLLGVRSGPTFDWLASFATRTLAHNNSGTPVTMRQSAWSSGSNASAQEGFVSAALAAYLGDADLLAWNWTAFRRYAGDRTSTWKITSNSDAWQMVPADPVGIQAKGAVKSGIRLAGAISNDMSRGGGLAWPPSYTSYPWVGLEGAVPAAVVLSRQGYPAFAVVDSALRRAAEYLYAARVVSGNVDWYDTARAPEVKHILNDRYGLGYPEGPTKLTARTFSFTDWLSP